MTDEMKRPEPRRLSSQEEAPERPRAHEPEGSYNIHGDIHTGAFGTGASANVGAIGERSRGRVTVVRDPAEEGLVTEMLELLEELRDALDEHRETMDGEMFATVETNIDELEESLEEMKPARRIRDKLKTLEALLRPFEPLVGLVGRIIDLIPKSES